MQNKIKKVKESLKLLSNIDLQRVILIPLLESLQYFNIEVLKNTKGNQLDHFFCYEKGQLQRYNLSIAIPLNSGSIKMNVEIIEELSIELLSYFSEKYSLEDKYSLHPSQIHLILLFETELNHLEGVLQSFVGADYMKYINIIEYDRFIELLFENRKDIVDNLLGTKSDITTAMVPLLNNKILMNALGSDNIKDIRSFYIDIDFSLGKVTTKLFFTISYTPRRQVNSLTQDDWSSMKKLLSDIEPEFEKKIIGIDIVDIEKKYEKAQDTYRKWKRKLETLRKKSSDLRAEILALDSDIKEFAKKTEDENGYYDSDKDDSKEIVEKKAELNRKELEHIELSRQIKAHQESETPPYYEVSINGKEIAEALGEKRQSIEDKVYALNTKKKPTTAEIKAFIEKCNGIINKATIILNNRFLFDSLLTNKNLVYRKNLDSTRLKLPIHKVFDSEINIAVLGEAGAGKTTCLQMYAYNGLQNTSNKYFWIPLSRLSDYFPDSLASQDSEERKEGVNILLDSIARFLQSKGVNISLSNFKNLILKVKTVLLLDGIDEVIKSAPWLLRAIRNLAAKYQKIQIITSSRMSGNYLSEIPFFAVTLLPFTDEQRTQFIGKWFGNGNDDLVKKITTHLSSSKAVSDVIRNPLLTTTLCVIAKNGLPLPTTELKLYESRLNLLTGYYDNMKKLSSRLSTTSSSLQLVAQKLAFKLHKDNTREFSLSDEEVVRQINKEVFLSVDDLMIALRELIDPCNLLVPMTEDGKFGFGHLRYQEYLAAKEIINNRSINIIPLLSNIWWKGVLILFIRMNSDIKWMIHDLGYRNEVSLVKEKLMEMISYRPKIERKELQSLVKKYYKLEEMNNRSPWNLEDR